MKKILAIVLTLSFISVSAFSQSRSSNNEIRLSFSDGIPFELGSALGNVFVGVFTNRDITESSGTGHWSLAYRNHTSNRIAVGGDVTFQSVSYDFEYKNSDETGSERINFVSIMPAFEFTYYQNKLIRLYGAALAGITILNMQTDSSDDSNVMFAFQVNPIGVRIGKQFGGFLELGAGSKGFLTLGASVVF